MNEINGITGQRINYKEGNDNSPPKYSAPSVLFKETLSYFANKWCDRCRGTGYICEFKHIVGGRCFKCIPDDYWNRLLGDYKATGFDVYNNAVCEIRYLSKDICSEAGFVVADIGLPLTCGFEVFSTIDEACEYARKKYSFRE